MKLQKRLKTLAHDRRGSIGIIFALTLLPMALLSGVAIDYSNTSRLNARLKAAADMAALSAVRDYVVPGNQSRAISQARNVFLASLKNTAQLSSPDITFAASTSGPTVTMTATYSGKVDTWFSGLTKVSSINLGGTAVASFQKPAYKNFYFVVNQSESMGLAATKADIETMKRVAGCELACHVPQTNLPPGSKSNEQIARENNVTLRLDVIKNTMNDILNQVKADPVGSVYYKFVIYPFAYAPSDAGMPSPAAPSSNFSALITAVNAIGLTHTKDPEGFTNHRAALKKLANSIGKGGNGDTAATAQNYIFLLTDGVEDVDTIGRAIWDVSCLINCQWYKTPPLNTRAIDPADCANLKTSAAATFGVVYTTYLPLPSDGAYTATVGNFVGQIGPALKSCADSGYFYEGTEAPDISHAMQTLFQTAAGSVRLTQ